MLLRSHALLGSSMATLSQSPNSTRQGAKTDHMLDTYHCSLPICWLLMTGHKQMVEPLSLKCLEQEARRYGASLISCCAS